MGLGLIYKIINLKLKEMEIIKETTKYDVSHSVEDIVINGTFNVLYDKLDYVRLVATTASTINIDNNLTTQITPIGIGTLEYKASIGKPSISVSDINAYMPLINVFEQIKKEINDL